MPSAKRKPNKKSKSVVGGLKSKSKWKIGFLALAALLLVSAVGYVGYGKYKVHQLQAQAESWTVLVGKDNPFSHNTKALACKTAVSGPFGNLWRIKFLVQRGTPQSSNSIMSKIYIDVYPANDRYSYTVAASQDKWLFGAVAGTEAYVSRDLGQKIRLRALESIGIFYYYTPYINELSPFNPAELANC